MGSDTAVSKYVIRLTIKEKLIGLKPFLHNTLGNIILALIQELRDINVTPEMKAIIQFNPTNEQKVQLQVNEATLELNAYIQDMIQKTISGFLLTLKDMPQSLHEMLSFKVKIEFRYR